MLWIQFIVCAALIIAVGTGLSRYADILAEKTGLGRNWIGAVLLAGATSLPELATGVSAIVVVNDVNLAVGGILGSCLFNLLLIAMLDAASGSTPILKRAEISHILAAGLGCALLAVVLAGLFVSSEMVLPALGWVGLPSLLIFAIYVIGVRMMGQFERRRTVEVLEQQAEVYQYAAISLGRAVGVFVALSLAIVGLGIWLAALGEQIIAATGLGASFVGMIFLAITTSLPEVVASFAALRFGAVDLAVANIFGSNVFNIAILVIYDLAYTKGSMWTELRSVHGFSAIVAIFMTSLAIIGLMYKAVRKPRWALSWTALFLTLTYAGSLYVVYVTTR
jgi:cation:H+ antiporter